MLGIEGRQPSVGEGLFRYLQNKVKYTGSKFNGVDPLRLKLNDKFEMWQWLHKPFLG